MLESLNNARYSIQNYELPVNLFKWTVSNKKVLENEFSIYLIFTQNKAIFSYIIFLK